MPDLLQHAVRMMLNGLLTELPAQLLTAAVAAAVAAWWRAHRQRRVTPPAREVPPATDQ
ncbi:hypothetical protein JIX56_00130 [Streptomyces sp. CA-210063]|uniref:hypothetical protein n=1 Tax=Streptomyces sp. CA-210063 TaxID=2801029 RepID=UPI00214AB171|nr:hypothetical protein [Streptomyces sp. CA-210063]UUU28459.1 hypothetical protein JIX56_00130 [Streptomyces sp. CA-210063]